jgi:GNAT superfamily N-acetyltransferase
MLDDRLAFGHADGPEWLDMLDDVTGLYLAIRSDLDDNSSINTRESFVDRTTRQTARDGFSAVWARADDALIGFAFGLRLPAGGWWTGESTAPPPEILNAPKFALIELDVAVDWRGRGIGHTLHDMLLEGRPEPYAILTTVAGRPARDMYDRWGWEQVGTAQHAPDAPVMDQLVLRLHG